MKLVISLAMLLLTVYAAPTDKQEESKLNKTWRENLAQLFKEYRAYLVQRITNIMKENNSKIAEALVSLTHAEDWDEKISALFKENAQRTVKIFLDRAQQKTTHYENWAEYFKGETDDLINGLLQLIGANGDDLVSTSRNILNVTLNKLLPIFGVNLEEEECIVISDSVGGLVKTVLMTIKDRQNWAIPLADYIRSHVPDLVAVSLKRLLGDDSNIYKFISTVAKQDQLDVTLTEKNVPS
uniref:Uncharacterized protein n=1 Tax=Schistocephalus solidus TaxID=70667 RepID=A0A0X3QAS7_SCHSO